MTEFRGIELIQSQLVGANTKDFLKLQDDLSEVVQWHVIANALEFVDNMATNNYDQYLDFFSDESEPLEFWVVSGWLATRLRKVGELVVDVGDVSIWGRCCSGQAIYMDTEFAKAACYSFDKGELPMIPSADDMTELSCIHDSCKSFYGKAQTYDDRVNNVLTLYSYLTPVVTIDHKRSFIKFYPPADQSVTTRRHVKEFMRQKFNKQLSTKAIRQILEDYPDKGLLTFDIMATHYN